MKSWNELRELRASAAKEIALRNPGASAVAGPERLHVLVCAGTGCTSSSSALIMEQMQQQLTARGLDQEVRVIKTGCFGLCQKGPIVAVYPDKIFYCHVKPDDVGEIIEQHFIGGQPVKRLEMNDIDEITQEKIFDIDKIRFYAKQQRIALKNCGQLDPENIREYIARDGYEALAKALHEMQPQEVIDEIKKSGLRGRGGAGFPTGVKWTFIPPNNTKPVYLVCNCDESEPGTFKDRYIVHQDPHQLIEGMVISSYAVGAHLAYIYMREEFPIAAETMLKALQEARERGFLGKNILGSGYDLEIHLHRGAGAYICGEETALLNSLEGVRPYPRIKPPYFPAAIGLYGCPTIVNNVESLCQVKHVIAMGGEAYGQEGAKRSPGTRIIGVSGDVRRPGYYEIVSGSMTFGELLYDVCGGPREGREFKAVIPGGSSSKVMRTDVEYKTRNPDGTTGKISFFDIPLDLDSIAQYGSMSGSGAVIVMDDSRSMPWALNNINRFYAHESCGQCTPCREGCPWMMKLSTRILEGKGAPSDVDLLIQVANQIEGKTVCAFGEAASWPTQAMVSKFKEEFVALTDPFNACLPHSAEGREQRRYFIR